MTKVILLAAPNDDWRDLLIHVIYRCGYEVIAVSKPEEIIPAAGAGADLILLDLGLVRDRAEALIKELQGNRSTNHIPILCEATYGTEWAAPRLIKAGAKQVLYKPFDLSNLPSIFREYLSNEPYYPLQPYKAAVPATYSAAGQTTKPFKTFE